MSSKLRTFAIWFFYLYLSACRGGESEIPCSGPGYWFELIFIVLPLIILLLKVFTDLTELKETQYSLETQLRRINTKLEEMEAKEAPEQSKPRRKEAKTITAEDKPKEPSEG